MWLAQREMSAPDKNKAARYQDETGHFAREVKETHLQLLWTIHAVQSNIARRSLQWSSQSLNCDILICLIAFALKALERLEGIDHIGSPHLEQGPTSKCLAKALWKDYGLNTLHIYLWEYQYESYTSRLSIEAKADLLVDRAADDTGVCMLIMQ